METSHPGNIGAVARAMKNMDVSELVLVRPDSFPDPVADARSSGALDILASARVRRRACTVPDTESIYKLVALTDIAAVTGRSFVNHHNIDGQLVVLDMPFELPEIDLHLAWTLAADSDRGHQWLRERMLSVLRSASRVMNFEVIAGDEEDGTA